jgi:hypothetical protein
MLDQNNVYITNPLNAEYIYYNKFRNISDTYVTEDVSSASFNESWEKANLVKTAAVQSNCDLLRNILRNDERALSS